MFEQIKDWWEGNSEREQKLTLISVLVIIVALAYFMIWQPIKNNLEASEQRLNNAQQTLQWVEVNSNKLIVAGLGNSKVGEKQNLTQLINRTANREKINIARIQSRNNSVNIWINQIEFNQFLQWMTQLQNQYQVKITSADLTRDNVQGMIKVNRLSLSY